MVTDLFGSGGRVGFDLQLSAIQEADWDEQGAARLEGGNLGELGGGLTRAVLQRPVETTN